MNTILEAPDMPAEPTPADTSVPTQTSGDAPQAPEQSETPETPATSPEAAAPQEFDVEGEKVTAAQIKEWKEKYGRDSKWVQSNEARAAELNRQEEELRQLRALKPLLDQRPDVIQQLVQPRQQRDFDAELRNLYANRPDPNIDYNGYLNWEYQKDTLNREATAYTLQKQTEQKYLTQKAEEENSRVIDYGKQKYLDSKTVDASEFVRMTNWIDHNYKTQNGIVPKEAYDIAFKVLFEDKFLSQVKIDTAKRAVSPLLKTTQSDNGINKPRVAKTEQDLQDDSFISAMKERSKG